MIDQTSYLLPDLKLPSIAPYPLEILKKLAKPKLQNALQMAGGGKPQSLGRRDREKNPSNVDFGYTMKQQLTERRKSKSLLRTNQNSKLPQNIREKLTGIFVL